MEARAIGRYLRVTPRKARYVLDAVRGKGTHEALAMLKFVPNEAARYVRDVIESAVANAEHNYAMDRDALRITRAFVDVGPTMKRIHPRAMGRAYRILKRMSHITVVVGEDETLKRAPAKPKGRSTGRAQTARKASAPQAERKPGAAKAQAKPATRAAKSKPAESAPEKTEE